MAEKLSTEGAGFPGIKIGTENNTMGVTRVEVGEPGGKLASQGRAVDRSASSSTDRFPNKGSNPGKDKWGDTKNSVHPNHGR